MNELTAGRTFHFRLAMVVFVVMTLLVLQRAGVAHAQAAAQGGACFPACRNGFVCLKGQCVSACNPVCAANEKCTAAGECVSSQPQQVRAVEPSASQPPAAPPAPAGYVPAPPASAPGVDRSAGPTSGTGQLGSFPSGNSPMRETPAAEPAPGAGRGAYLHNGFYLRLGLGLGGASTAAEATSSNRSIDGGGVEARSVAIPLEIAIGGTPARGFVIGAGSYASVWPAPHDKLKNLGQNLESDAGPIVISSVGPFADWYFNPEQGFHAQVAATFASANVAKSQDGAAPVRVPNQAFSGTGWSTVWGLGWEAWIGPQWSAGILGRVQYGRLSLKGVDSNDKMETAFLIVGALASFTYH